MKVKMQRWLSILLAITLIFSWFPASVGANEEQHSSTDVENKVEQSLEDAKQYYENNPLDYSDDKGFHSQYWEFAALWGAGYKDLKNDFPWTDSNPWSNHTYWTLGKDDRVNMAKEEMGIIIGSLLLGNDPYEFGSRNIVKDLLDRKKESGTFSDLFGEPWALIALDLVDADYDREEHLQAILETQSDLGTFGGTDSTGWMLTALAPYQDDAEVQEAINKSVKWAHDSFVENEEFPGMGPTNSSSTSAIIMGLAAVGEDLYSDKWSKDNGSLVEQLIEYQQDDGSFWWQKDKSGAIRMSTEQALLALATVENGQSIFIDLKNEIEDKDESNDDDIDLETLESIIKETVDHVIEQGVFSEWTAIGIAQAGFEIPESYTDSFYSSLESQIVEQDIAKITDIERLALAAQVIDLDPQNIEGLNLIEHIYNSTIDPNNNYDDDTMTSQGINGPIFALIALDSGMFTVPEDARWTREKLIEYLLEMQTDNGGWALFGTEESYDITAMVLIALGNYKENSDVEQAIERAVSFLSESQNNEGGFNDPWNGGISVEAASQVMIGLTTAGIDPLSENYRQGNGSLINHILDFRADDGGFKHLPDDSNSNSMATEQALQALVAYQRFLTDDENLYYFGTNDEEDSDDDQGEPGDSDEKEEPEDGEEESVEIENDLGEEVDVGEGYKKIVINDSKVEIILPDNLPKGTKVKVNTPDKKTIPFKSDALSGDIFNFHFNYPKGEEDYKGNFQLTLGVDDYIDIQRANVYYYNESTNTWEIIDGEKDEKNHTITVEVDHFSIYGVFINNPTLDIDEDDPTESEESNSDTNTGETGGESSEGADGKNKNEPSEETEKNDLVSSESEELREDGNKLPKTATNMYNLMLFGLLLLVLGSGTFAVLKCRAGKVN